MHAVPRAELKAEVEGRVRLVLEKDYKRRHGGVLRSPADLVLHRRYDRPEIVNHFGVQYDPAKHNGGVIVFGKNIVIITKLDTSGAKSKFQYSNAVVSESKFRWQSQNKQTQENQSGRVILDHVQQGRSINLFVQSQSHMLAANFGRVFVHSVTGNGPMTVEFRLEHELTPQMFTEFCRTSTVVSNENETGENFDDVET